MSNPSLKHQIKRALDELVNISDPSSQVILTPEEKPACLENCLEFFTLAHEQTGDKLLVDLLTNPVILRTFDTYYYKDPWEKNQVMLNDIEKLYQGALRIYKKTKKRPPITNRLRGHVRILGRKRFALR
jgi:hypothetical protein